MIKNFFSIWYTDSVRLTESKEEALERLAVCEVRVEKIMVNENEKQILYAAWMFLCRHCGKANEIPLQEVTIMQSGRITYDTRIVKVGPLKGGAPRNDAGMCVAL